MDNHKILNTLLDKSYVQSIEDYSKLLDMAPLILRSISDVTHQQIADKMNIGVPTLRYKLKRHNFNPAELLRFYDAIKELTISQNVQESKKE